MSIPMVARTTIARPPMTEPRSALMLLAVGKTVEVGGKVIRE